MKTHAIAYYRTSSAANVGEGKDSLPRQREAVTGFAAAHAMHIVAEYYDAAMPGTVQVHERPEFARLLSHIEGNGVRLVLIEDASRFARDLLVQEAGLAMLANRGVRVVTASGDDLTDTTDPMRKMLRQIVGAVVEAEKARLVAKLRGARDRAAKNGYRVEGKSYARRRPELLAALRELREADPDATMQELANRLAERGFLTERGKPLARQAVHRTLAQMG